MNASMPAPKGPAGGSVAVLCREIPGRSRNGDGNFGRRRAKENFAGDGKSQANDGVKGAGAGIGLAVMTDCLANRWVQAAPARLLETRWEAAMSTGSNAWSIVKTANHAVIMGKVKLTAAIVLLAIVPAVVWIGAILRGPTALRGRREPTAPPRPREPTARRGRGGRGWSFTFLPTESPRRRRSWRRWMRGSCPEAPVLPFRRGMPSPGSRWSTRSNMIVPASRHKHGNGAASITSRCS